LKKVRAGDLTARKGFDEVLGRGEIDLSYDLLNAAGVELNTAEPFDAVIRRMNGLLDEFQDLLKQAD
jgi:oligoendopeptidase F